MRGFLLLLVLSLFFRVILLGEVIAPHPNDRELAASSRPPVNRIINRKFSDFSSEFLPNMAFQMRSNSQSWLPQWDPHNELGRPSFNTISPSRAFLLVNAVTALFDAPYAAYSALIFCLFVLTAWASYGLLRAMAFSPAAALCGSIVATFAISQPACGCNSQAIQFNRSGPPGDRGWRTVCSN